MLRTRTHDDHEQQNSMAITYPISNVIDLQIQRRINRNFHYKIVTNSETRYKIIGTMRKCNLASSLEIVWKLIYAQMAISWGF